MKTCVAIVAVVGIATSIHAQTRLEYQVSLSGAENWQSSLNVAPGTAVDIRARVSYVGTNSALGLGSIIFQPTVSNWLPGDAVPNVPTVGWSVDGPGVYGKMSPFFRTNGSSTLTNYIGHVNTVGGTTFMRMALPQVTSWFGGTGNTTGDSGILIGQVNRDDPLLRIPSLPAFSGQTQDIVVFKFQVLLGLAPDFRSLLVDTPVNGFGNRQSSGFRTGNWFSNFVESTGSIREAAFTTSAVINVVPAPSSIALLGFVGLAANRRRRR